LTSQEGEETVRGGSLTVLPIIVFMSLCPSFFSEPGISIRLDSYRDRRAGESGLSLLSLPPEEWCRQYESESIVYVPGEKAHVTVEIPRNKASSDGEISVGLLVSGERRVLHRGRLESRTYGPYEVAITSDFEVYQVRVQVGDETAVKPFYGIRPWRGMKHFAEAVSPHGIALRYMKPGWAHKVTTPWDEAVKEGGVPLRAIDSNWAMASHVKKTAVIQEDWWLWTHYACGMVGLHGGRTGLCWGEYNPCVRPVRLTTIDPQTAARVDQSFCLPFVLSATAIRTHTMLPNEIYFRERMQPMLRKWAQHLSDKHPGAPLSISLGGAWGIGRGIGKHFAPEILRFFVSWMKEQFGITIEADTFKELIRKCKEYPRHFEYFIARNTTFRSLELTCEAVQDIVADSKACDLNGESNRQLITLPEAAEFCDILSRCVSVGTSDDRAAFRLTQGNPLPYSLSNMIIKAFTPDHTLCVGWNGCPGNAADGEIYRWYLEPAWITAYDAEGQLHHVYTHSPPRGSEGVWRSLIELGASSEKIRIHDKCFQLMEVIGVEKPMGPVFVCKDWTFADDKAGRAYRSDLYEDFLISLRRHKVPISCAVHADTESNLPDYEPKVYAPRMNGLGEIRCGFRAGSVEKWFTCGPSEIPGSLIADFASQLSSATGNPIVFPPGTSIEGYAFEAKGTIFIVAEETAGRKEHGEIKVEVGPGRWTVIDVISGKEVGCRRDGEYLTFGASLGPNSATLYCVAPKSEV